MKRYLFLKLGLTILICAAASSGAQFSDKLHLNKESKTQENLHKNNQGVVAVGQRGDTKNDLQDYQGVMGKPGVDFPVLTYIPRTKFTCRGKRSGYYGDLETNCQVFHICDEGRKVSFLCPNGTIFQQSDLICDWWFKVDCASSPSLYDESAEQLYEETIKRKEIRRIQQQERRAKLNANRNENIKQDREFSKQTKTVNAPIQEQSNLAKKDVNHYTSEQFINKHNDNAPQRPRDSYTNIYKETQVPSETASFINNRYNNQPQKHYLNIVNDVTEKQANYLQPKTFTNNNFATSKTVTEKVTRGRTYNTPFTTERVLYRNQVSDTIKTTTQHTIYSPTIPPFTTTKTTTRQPLTQSINSFTEKYGLRLTSARNKPLSGFYITKEIIPVTTLPATNTQSLTLNYKGKEEITTYRNPTSIINFETTTLQTKNPSITDNQHNKTEQTTNIYYTTTETVNPAYQQLYTSATISEFKESNVTKATTGDSFDAKETTEPNQETTVSLQTTTEQINFSQDSRTPKEINFSTELPFTLTNRIPPSVPSPFKLSNDYVQRDTNKQEANDTSTTSRFNHYTYLPKSTEDKIATPKPTVPTDYTTYNTAPIVTENISNMIKTLQDLEDDVPSIEVDKYLESRPGLNIPPSAGPKTLHSLAIYFATALDNLVSQNETNHEEELTTISTVDDSQVTLLSRNTQDKYNYLFNENNAATSNSTSNDTGNNNINSDELNLKSLVEHDAHYNDLDGQQSRGPITSTPRIRQLAQVFTQALSAYLDDPDTFKKVLEEIRPTEPPLFEDTFTTSASTATLPTTTEYHSYTKEEDEVLDFSDVDKSSTYRPFNDISKSTPAPNLTLPSTSETVLTDTSETFTARNINISSPSPFVRSSPTPNSLALDLNNRLKLSTSSSLQDIDDDDDDSFTEESTESTDYFPFKTSGDIEDIERRATAKPYGFGVKPENSTAISLAQEVTTDKLNEQTTLNFNRTYDTFKPFESLLPPFEVTNKFGFNNSFVANEEYLQSAHSQSFVAHANALKDDREGKSINTDTTETISSTTDLSRTEETFSYTIPNEEIYTSTPIPATTILPYTVIKNEPHLFTSRHSSFPGTTENSGIFTTTDAPTTPTVNDYTTQTTREYTTQEYTATQTTNFYKTTQIPKEFNTRYSTDSTTMLDTTTVSPTQTTNTNFVPENHWSKSPEVAKLWETTLYINPLLINRNFEDKFIEGSDVELGTARTDKTDLTTQAIHYKTTTEQGEESIIDLKFTSTTEDLPETIFSTLTPPVTNEPYAKIIDLGIHTLLNSTEREIATSQAQQIFGKLDSNEQDILIEKMKEAESNSTVRRLILLLVSTCDANLSNNKTVQETRNSILHALLHEPLNRSTDNSHEITNRADKQLYDDDESNREKTTILPETTSHLSDFSNTNFAITDTPENSDNSLNVKNINEDTRALELLRSLYSLAAKWGKK